MVKYTKFLGIGHVSEECAKGHSSAIKEGVKDTVDFEFILSLINHISTDGEKRNVGQHNGLWKILDFEHDALKIEKPILQFVCALHSSALAFKVYVKKSMNFMFLLPSYLESVHRFSQYYEIRWAEFTESLLNSILISWRVLILYFAQTTEPTGIGLGKFLTNFDHIVDVPLELKKMQDKLRKISEKPILGGWEEAFGRNYSDGMFFEVRLWNKEPRIEGRHSFIKERKGFTTIRHNSITAFFLILD